MRPVNQTEFNIPDLAYVDKIDKILTGQIKPWGYNDYSNNIIPLSMAAVCVPEMHWRTDHTDDVCQELESRISLKKSY